MVEVRWDFQGVALDMVAAEKAVGRVVRFYQEALRDITCPVHDKRPGLVVKGQTQRRLQVSIETCCAELLERANTQVNGVSRRAQD